MDQKKKKGFASLIVDGLGKPPKKGGDLGSASPGGQSPMDDKEMAAQDVLSAMKSGDASALSDALSSFVKLCESDYESSENESEEPSEG